jgi:hypothetical protein
MARGVKFNIFKKSEFSDVTYAHLILTETSKKIIELIKF